VHLHHRVDSLKALLGEGYDAVFVGTGAPRGRDLDVPGRKEAAANIHIGIDWLSQRLVRPHHKIGKRVIVLGGGNTAMDCCRTARRLGGEDVKVIVRSGFEEMKASPWEKEDAMHEASRSSTTSCRRSSCTRGRQADRHDLREGRRRSTTTRAAAAGADRRARPVPSATTCWSRSARRTPSPGSSATSASSSTSGACPVDEKTFQSTLPKVFFGGDAAFGPKNIIWAVAHGHEAAISIDLFLQRRGREARPRRRDDGQPEDGHPRMELRQRDRARPRYKVPHAPKEEALKDIKVEVELGFDRQLGFKPRRSAA
jgi:formate dehydrogenase beta subunit